MRKSKFMQQLALTQENFSQEEITLMGNHILQYLSNTLGEKGRIEIRGFGNLTVNYQAPRTARNPKTSKVVEVPGKYKVHFKMGKELKDRLNPT